MVENVRQLSCRRSTCVTAGLADGVGEWSGLAGGEEGQQQQAGQSGGWQAEHGGGGGLGSARCGLNTKLEGAVLSYRPQKQRYTFPCYLGHSPLHEDRNSETLLFG